MTDPTYNKEEIAKKPEWYLAWVLSEIMNGSAPIGWGRYIGAAQCLLGSVKHDGRLREILNGACHD